VPKSSHGKDPVERTSIRPHDEAKEDSHHYAEGEHRRCIIAAVRTGCVAREHERGWERRVEAEAVDSVATRAHKAVLLPDLVEHAASACRVGEEAAMDSCGADERVRSIGSVSRDI
jgi:hypothetical protein